MKKSSLSLHTTMALCQCNLECSEPCPRSLGADGCHHQTNCSHCLHSTAVELLAMKELFCLQEQIKGTSKEDVPEFIIATMPKCQLQVVPHLTVCCHMAQAVKHLNKMCAFTALQDTGDTAENYSSTLY